MCFISRSRAHADVGERCAAPQRRLLLRRGERVLAPRGAGRRGPDAPAHPAGGGEPRGRLRRVVGHPAAAAPVLGRAARVHGRRPTRALRPAAHTGARAAPLRGQGRAAEPRGARARAPPPVPAAVLRARARR